MIRPATQADRPRIEEIVEAAYTPWAELIGVRPIPMDANYTEFIEAGQIFVTNDDLNGLIVLIPEKDTLLIENVAVAPTHHGQGIGHRLLSFAEDHARMLSLPRIRLYTNELMKTNIALYTSLGYHETGRQDVGGRYVVHMSKDLA
ncbi:GNAT family N-acetyltransferase [Actinomadura meridiana]|uniref:GNAT family N-acetyltransferase n=1 Tax=Actinomadura meridiana TaxID=559626 RepID=A0ABP8CBT0_9ACTN